MRWAGELGGESDLSHHGLKLSGSWTMKIS